MIIHDLDLVRTPVAPEEANAPLAVDANAVLPLAISTQHMKLVPTLRFQIIETIRSVERHQLQPNSLLHIRMQAAHRDAFVDRRGTLVREAFYHGSERPIFFSSLLYAVIRDTMTAGSETASNCRARSAFLPASCVLNGTVSATGRLYLMMDDGRALPYLHTLQKLRQIRLRLGRTDFGPYVNLPDRRRICPVWAQVSLYARVRSNRGIAIPSALNGLATICRHRADWKILPMLPRCGGRCR